MKVRLIKAIFIGSILALTHPSAESKSGAAKPVDTHPRYTIKVELDPPKHLIRGTTEIALAGAPGEIEFTLRDGLQITSIVANGRPVKIETVEKTDAPQKSYRISLFYRQTPRPGLKLSISYFGEIYDPITSPEKGTFVIGDRTTGIIGEEGVYLDDATGWYPRISEDLALYTAEATVPPGWVVISQGDIVDSRQTTTGTVFRFTSDVPFDGIALVAGKYTITERKKGGILLRAVFFPEEQPLSDLFLNHLEENLEKYQELFGFYPYQRFDIVENFFTTGYAFPTFTLLGKDVIKLGERALQPGYLDHELVHSWFGNYLYFRRGTGNWVEGLTTYFANYFAREQEGPEAARAYRFGQMLRYSVRVSPQNDYPLRQFEGKQEDFENDIGYGKASMFFHLLRRMMGEDVFLIVVRDMIHRYGGKFVDWDDFRKEMEPIMRADLSRYFSDWLDHPGIPDLRLENSQVEQDSDGGFVVTGRILQTGHAYSLNVPIRVYWRDGGFVDKSVWIDSSETFFRLKMEQMPERIELDPDFHIFRRIPTPEIPPNLNAALKTGNLLVLVPEKPGAYQPLVDRLKNFPGVTVETAVAGRSLPEQSFLLIGRYDENPLTAAWGKLFQEWIQPTPEGIKIKGILYNEPDHAVMIWVKSPRETGQYAGIYWGNAEEALSRARLLPYYGWESVVVFKKGSPVLRWTPLSDYPSWSQKVVPTFLAPSPSRLRGIVEFLARPESKGRRAGTPEADQAASFLVDAFKAAGLKPLPALDPDADYLQPFVIEIIDLDPKKATFLREPPAKKDETIDYWPLITSPEGTYRWSKWVGINGIEDLADKSLPEGDFAVWFPAEKAVGWTMADWYVLIQHLQLAGCVALVIVGDPAAVPGIPPPYFDYPSRPAPYPQVKPPEGSPRLFHEVFPLMRHAKNQANLLIPVQKLTMPILVVHPAEFTAKRITSGRRWTLHLHFGRHEVKTANVVGYLPATESTGRDKWLVVGAHYDHLGTTTDGVILPGAVDNAAGVAALTEAASLLSVSSYPRNLAIVFVAFSGEEWGLRGSQAFVRSLPENIQVPYMINLDAVGGRESPEVYLIGASQFQGLARIAESSLRRHGLSPGKDIDRYALRAGSDFWPFLESGIPVLGIYDAEYTLMDQPEDNLSAVNFPKLEKISSFLVSFIYDLTSRG